jgi:hypothetical protein
MPRIRAPGGGSEANCTSCRTRGRATAFTTTTVRPGVAFGGVTEWAFVQVDAGMDVFYPADAPEPMRREIGYHTGVAAGPRMGPFTGYAELARFECLSCTVEADGSYANVTVRSETP